MLNMQYYIGNNGLKIFYNGKSYSIDKTSFRYYEDIVNALNKKDFNTLKYLLENKSQALKDYMIELNDIDGITIVDSNVYLDGEILNETLAIQINRHFESGVSSTPLINFIRKLRNNMSFSIMNQLYGFIDKSMEDGGFTIDKDGDIIAYKKVNKDYTDIYTGKILNKIGCKISMKRSEVNDNPDQTCSNGLHFCSYSYLSKYSSNTNCRIMIVKINPQNVVSIPKDYSNSKGRCCEYLVINEIKNCKNECSIINEPVLNYNNYEEITKSFKAVLNKSIDKEILINLFTLKDFVSYYNYLTLLNIKKFKDKKTAINKILKTLITVL